HTAPRRRPLRARLPAHELAQQRDALPAGQRGVELVADAEDFVVDEDFDVGVELGELRGEATEDRAGGVASPDGLVEELAAGAVTTNVLRHPGRHLDLGALGLSGRLRFRLAGHVHPSSLLRLWSLLLAVEVFLEPAQVEGAEEVALRLAGLAVVVDRLVPDVEHAVPL